MKTTENATKSKDTVLTITEHPIEEWKEKHDKVKLITVTSKKHGGNHDFIIGRPTLSMMDSIAKYSNDGKPHKIRELLRNSCVKAGDKTLIDTDDDLRNTVFERITELFEKLEVEEKEL